MLFTAFLMVALASQLFPLDVCTGDNVPGPCRDPLGSLALLPFAMTMLSLRKTVKMLSGEKYLPGNPEHLNSHLQNTHKVGQTVHTFASPTCL